MDQETYSVYVRVDECGRITAINSSAFLSDPDGWTKIDEGGTFNHRHAQGNYLPEPILTEKGAFRYKLVDGAVQRRTDAEIEADATGTHLIPTQMDRIEAQVTYTAMMTGTLLEV